MLTINHHVFSKGTLVLAVSLILCTGKWIKLFTKTVHAFNLHIGLNLQENQVHHSKERQMLVWEQYMYGHT